MWHRETDDNMDDAKTLQSTLSSLDGQRFCTEEKPVSQRLEWLKEVVGREYANVEISPPKKADLYNDLLLFPWSDGIRLSPMRSNPCVLERLPQEPLDVTHDCYFAVVLTSGQYKLQQGGREVYLQPGEMSLYDATRPHRIEIPKQFSKILISIPRQMLDQRIADIGSLTATKIPTTGGVGAVTSTTIQSIVRHLHEIDRDHFVRMADHVLDLFTLSVEQVGKGRAYPSRHRELTLKRVKGYIAAHLDDYRLNAAAIASGTGLSARYINNLFSDEGTSVMRYVTRQRLEKCRRLIVSKQDSARSISEIALQCGFINMAHFSRAFKQRYGISPRACKTKSRMAGICQGSQS
jgi:AraC-like DNA-binding protein/mannose-6-phosphate isomerase-like protein (cupin superfamily)